MLQACVAPQSRGCRAPHAASTAGVKARVATASTATFRSGCSAADACCTVQCCLLLLLSGARCCCGCWFDVAGALVGAGTGWAPPQYSSVVWWLCHCCTLGLFGLMAFRQRTKPGAWSGQALHRGQAPAQQAGRVVGSRGVPHSALAGVASWGMFGKVPCRARCAHSMLAASCQVQAGPVRSWGVSVVPCAPSVLSTGNASWRG